MAAWLAGLGWGDAERRPLVNDASFRRYERLVAGRRTAILMDAPPPREDVRPYLAVARFLGRQGFSAPRIAAADTDAGFLVIEDLGDATFTRELARGADETALYRLAVDVLIALHRCPAAPRAPVPAYDDRRLLEEAALFVEWYLPAVRGEPGPAAPSRSYLDAWRAVLPKARAVPDTLVLRDFHIDNLMRLGRRHGIRACGLLDFQDAVTGPVSYDLVSLLADARRDVPPALEAAMRARYLAAFPALDAAAFARSYAILGAQRAAKIIGIFTRLCHRDGKPHYLRHIPRVWRRLERDLCHPDLAPVADWFRHQVPAAMRAVPPARTAA